MEEPIPPVRTSEFLGQNSDDDRLYWWDGTDEILQNSSKTEYRAAVKLLKKLSDENREEGKIIEEAGRYWDCTSRRVTHNVGRLRLKRYLSVMANSRLREKYFGF